MNPEDIAQLKKLNIQLQASREWKERLNAKFYAMVKRMFGQRAGELVEWYCERMFRGYTWEQKRRVELELILVEHCPELLTTPTARPEDPPEPAWFHKSKAA